MRGGGEIEVAVYEEVEFGREREEVYYWRWHSFSLSFSFFSFCNLSQEWQVRIFVRLEKDQSVSGLLFR